MLKRRQRQPSAVHSCQSTKQSDFVMVVLRRQANKAVYSFKNGHYFLINLKLNMIDCFF